jgi:CRISPR-associated protein Cas2
MREGDIVWLLALFDLPAVSPQERRAHTSFRNRLLRLGFTRLQWSVYARAYPRERATETDRNAILATAPSGGRVRLLVVTDMQFGRMICVDGGQRCQPEKQLGQIVVLE